MADESQVGIGFQFRTNTDALENLTRAIRELNTNIEALNKSASVIASAFNNTDRAAQETANTVKTLDVATKAQADSAEKAALAEKNRAAAMQETAKAAQSTAATPTVISSEAIQRATENFARYEAEMQKALVVAREMASTSNNKDYAALIPLLEQAIAQRRLLTDEEIRAKGIRIGTTAVVGLSPEAVVDTGEARRQQEIANSYRMAQESLQQVTLAKQEGVGASQAIDAAMQRENTTAQQLAKVKQEEATAQRIVNESKVVTPVTSTDAMLRAQEALNNAKAQEPQINQRARESEDQLTESKKRAQDIDRIRQENSATLQRQDEEHLAWMREQGRMTDETIAKRRAEQEAIRQSVQDIQNETNVVQNETKAIEQQGLAWQTAAKLRAEGKLGQQASLAAGIMESTQTTDKGAVVSAMTSLGLSTKEAQAAYNEVMQAVNATNKVLQENLEINTKDTAATENLTKANIQSAASYVSLSAGANEHAVALRARGASVDEMRAKLTALGFSETEVNTALVPYIKNEENLARIRQENIALSKQQDDAARQSKATYDQLVASQEKATETGNAHGSTMRSNWSSLMALFGAAMMVNSAIQQLAAAQGEKANPAMVQFGKAIQEISSGAMMGMMFGPAGIAVGALTGLLTSLTVAMFSVDEQTANLNKQLDTLAKKDDVINALAKIADVSYSDAEAMMQVAKASPQAAKALQEYVDASREMSGVERTVGAVRTVFQGLGDDISKLGGKSIEIDFSKMLGRGVLEGVVEGLTKSTSAAKMFADQVEQLVGSFDRLRAVQAEVFKAQFDAIAPTQALNTALDGITKKGDAADVLSKIANVSRDQATNALEAAKNNAELARNLSDAKTSYDQYQQILAKLNIAEREGIDVSAARARAMQGLEISTLNLQHATEALTNAYQAQQDAQAAAQAASNLNKQMLDSSKIMADVQKANEDMAKAQREAADGSAKAWRSYQDALTDLSENRTAQLLKDKQDALKINQETTDQLSTAWRSLTEKQADIQQNLNDKLNDLAYDHAKQETTAQEDIVKKRKEYADKIVEIKREELQKLADLDYNTTQQLQKAKTENERGEIEARAMHERATIRENASQAMSEAGKSLLTAETESTKKKKLADDEYLHKVELAQREAAQQRATAERSYNDQVADLRKRNTAQLDALQQRIDAETAAYVNQQNDLHRRYEEQISDNRKRLAQQVMDEYNSVMEKFRAWQAETKALAIEYAQRLAIVTTYYDAVNKAAIASSTIQMTGTYQPGMQGQTMPKPGGGGGGSSGFGMAGGGSFTVPSGFPNDSFLMGLTSGEKVRVTPASQTTNSYGGNSATINVNHNDPEYILEVIRKHLQDNDAWQVS